jgi:hypothetical protein
MVPLCTVIAATGWITWSQATYGTSLESIRAQLRGEDVPGLALQAQLGAIWSHNPAGLPMGSTYESLRGLGGGITWSFDGDLCRQLLPLFSEGASLVVRDLVDCDGIKASVTRAFAKWSDNNRFLRFIDVTHECERLGLNRNGQTPGLRQESLDLPSNRDSAELRARRDTTGSEFSDFHGGCPLAEIWVTSLRRDRRDTSSVGSAAAGVAGDFAVAIAHAYWRER